MAEHELPAWPVFRIKLKSLWGKALVRVRAESFDGCCLEVCPQESLGFSKRTSIPSHLPPRRECDRLEGASLPGEVAANLLEEAASAMTAFPGGYD